MLLPDRTLDGHAATIVPTNVERLPLFHWRPGARLLAVGSRDGADFAGDLTADRSTFQRPLHSEMLRQALVRQDLSGIACTWSASLCVPMAIDAVLALSPRQLVVATPGIGEVAVLTRLLPVADAWLLLATADEQPLDRMIVDQGRHVEVLFGLDACMTIDWRRFSGVSAIHLVARRAAEADALDHWCEVARTKIPAAIPVYDHHRAHTRCRTCDNVVVWRHGVRSRCDGTMLQTVRGTMLACAVCGQPTTIGMHG